MPTVRWSSATALSGEYFYKNNVRLGAYQLAEYEGDFYFVNDAHMIARSKTLYPGEQFVAGYTYANGTSPAAGYYTFDENGKLVL